MYRLIAVLVVIFSLSAGIGCGRSAQTYVERGKRFFDEGKYADALIQYRKALQKDPKFGEAYYRLGLAELKENNGIEAYRSLGRAAEWMPDNEEVKISLADVSLALFIVDPHHAKPFYDQVAKLAEQLLIKDANSFHGMRLKGALALIDRKPKEAVEYYRKAERAKPMNPEVTLGLVQALLQDNQAQEGERLALELIQKEKTFSAIYNVLHQYYLATNRIADAESILKLKIGNIPKESAYVLQLARFYADTGKSNEMAVAIQRLTDNPKDFPQGRLHAGDFYNSLGKRDEAIRQFEEGIRTSPKDKLLYQRKIAETLAAQGKLEESSSIVDAMLKEQPEDEAALTARATLWLESGKPDKLDAAIAEFQALLKQKSNDASLRFNLGRALVRKGDGESARKEFLEAVRNRPNYLPPRFALAEMSLSQGKPGEALGTADGILRYAPNDARAKYLRAAALTGAGLYDKARSELNQLLRDFPQSRDIQLQLGLLAIAEKKYKEAEAIFQKLQKSGRNDPRLAAGLAATYTAQHQFNRTLQLLEEEVKKSPNSLGLRSLLASAAMQAGKYQVSVEQSQQVVSMNPKSVQAQIQLAQAQRQNGDINAAIATLEKVKHTAPKSPAAVLLLAQALESAGRVDEAKANYRQTLALEPDNAIALNNLAFLLANTGENLDEALRMIQRALQKTRDHIALSDTLGWIYLKKKMHDSALQTFRGLVKRYPENSTVRYHLGLTLVEKGDRAAAKPELEAALTKKPSPDEERKIRELLARIG